MERSHNVEIARSTGRNALVIELWSTYESDRARARFDRTRDSRPLRIVDFYGAFYSGGMHDVQVVCDTASQIDADLTAWRQRLPSSWIFDTVSTTTEMDRPGLGARFHRHPSRWVAEAWNDWRVLRILIHQIILDNHRGHIPTASIGKMIRSW